MPTFYPVTHVLNLQNGGGSGGTLSWTSSNDLVLPGNVVDLNEDGNFDIGSDYWFSTSYLFSGYVWTAPNGTDYPIFQAASGGLWLPYNKADYDVAAFLPSAGSTSNFSDNADGFPITVICFAEGTSISTPQGEQTVETIKQGDSVITIDGRTVSVKWVGRQTLTSRFRMAERLRVVRVKTGALGGGLPRGDLILTADHALLIDGLLINAGALVNGDSIDWMPVAEYGESFTIYHIETENHDVILAEGTPSETFIDYVGRQAFDNYAEYVALYGEDRTIAEHPAPRITAARQIPAQLRARLGITRAA